MAPYEKIVVMSGAGLSAESSIPTFRGPNGIWSRYSLEEVGTIEGFQRNPAKVMGFCNEATRLVAAARPNPAHLALAALQRAFGPRLTLATTNVDDLLEQAGATDVVHVHGRLGWGSCQACQAEAEVGDQLSQTLACTSCGQVGFMRPKMVFFGEWPTGLGRVLKAIAVGHLYVAIGTSAQVEPVAGLLRFARTSSFARTLEVNLEATEDSDLFDRRLTGPATKTVPRLVAYLTGREPLWSRLARLVHNDWA